MLKKFNSNKRFISFTVLALFCLSSSYSSAEQAGQPNNVKLSSARYQNLTIATDFKNLSISGFYNPNLDTKLAGNPCRLLIYGKLASVSGDNLPNSTERYSISIWNPKYPNEIYDAYLYSINNSDMRDTVTIQVPGSTMPRDCNDTTLFEIAAGASFNKKSDTNYPVVRVVKSSKAFFYKIVKGKLVKTSSYVITDDTVFIENVPTNLPENLPSGYVQAAYYDNPKSSAPKGGLLRESDLYSALPADTASGYVPPKE